jgi:hypothetical protein
MAMAVTIAIVLEKTVAIVILQVTVYVGDQAGQFKGTLYL